MHGKQEKLTVGWRESVALPGLGIPVIKAKLDTGARTSAIHAFALERFTERGAPRLRLWIHPRQRNERDEVVCEADIVDERLVTDSGGHRERRLVIETPLALAGHTWTVEMTVTNRDIMRFRLLIGRTAMHGRLLVDPGRSYVQGRRRRRRK